jgi:hypothetical protein
MRIGWFAIMVVVLIMVCPLLSADLKLGKPVDIKTPTAIKDILANPDQYLGRDVMIEGNIANVCQNAGCWIDVKDSSSPETLQVKVNDGEIVFPKDGAGKKVSAQGTVEKLVLTKEQYIEKLKHDEQESGKKADLSKVTGGVTIYRIKGKGAVIK